jgi:hypothetical protein
LIKADDIVLDSVASDRLDGAARISQFLGEPVWKIYADAAKGRPGLYRDGRRIRGSKCVLRRDHQDRANAGK